MRMRNPHLNHDGVDLASRGHHCRSCEKLLAVNHDPVETHILVSAQHFLAVNQAAIVERTKRGNSTGVFLTEARTVVSLYPYISHLRYCPEHAPVFAKTPTSCGGCGNPVDQTGERTELSQITLQTNKINRNFRNGSYHIGCLPAEFDPIRRERKRRKITTK